MMHARWINGNLAYWDTHQCRIIDALGASVVKYLEDFVSLPMDNTTHNPTQYTFSGDTANDSLTLPVSNTGGVAQIATGGVDNNETYFQLGAVNTHAPFVIAGAAGVANSKPLYFGARIKCLEHADEGVFVGLAEEGAAAGNFMADNSAVLADKDFCGFNILTATPAAWNITWRKNGQAVQTAANVVANADDWHVFEFWYDGATTVSFWVDGTLSATAATTTAATFPGAEEMSPIVGLKTGEAVAKNIQIDWLRVVQFN
jgi:hypothetical protein